MDQIEKVLESKEIRPTAMRILIYRHMEKLAVALSLTDIENTFSRIDRTTLYRTLKTFEEHSVVHQVDDGTGLLKYALCAPGCSCDIEQDLHLHFHCTNCNETQCLTDHKIPQFKLPEGFVAENVNLVVKGICNHCSV